MRLLYSISLAGILFSSCLSKPAKLEISEVVCSTDINDILNTFENHLCTLFNLYDENCIGDFKTSTIIRVTKWDDREENSISKIERIDGCLFNTKKVIPSHHFNAYGLLVEDKDVEYSVQKIKMSEIDFPINSDALKKSFLKPMPDYDKTLYIIDYFKATGCDRYFAKDSLTNVQNQVLERILIQ